jgi:hypothetical protein
MEVQLKSDREKTLNDNKREEEEEDDDDANKRKLVEQASLSEVSSCTERTDKEGQEETNNAHD